MFCYKCGKEINDGSVFCPECGANQNQNAGANTNQAQYQYQASSQNQIQKVPYNAMAVVGLVISCISLILNFWGLVGIAGTVVSVVGLLQCQKNNENGKALAIIGIAIGAFSILYGLYAIIVLSNML